MKALALLFSVFYLTILYGFAPPPNPPPPPFEAGFLPIVLVNNSLLPDNQINVVFIGRDPNLVTNQVFVNFDNNGMGSLAVANPGDNSSHYSRNLSQFPSTTGGHVAYLPYLQSGIFYFSVDNVLDMPVNPPHEIVQPSFTNPNDPNYNTNFDLFELNYESNAPSIFADATAVSFFSIPLYGYLSTPSANSLSNTGLFQPRNFILSYVANTFAAAPASKQWNNLILRKNSDILRILSPGKAMTAAIPVFDLNYLDDAAAYGYSYINDIWSGATSFYRTHPLKLTIPNGSLETYTGVINNDNTITFTSFPSQYQVVFAAPTTANLFSTSQKIFSGLFFTLSDNSPGQADGVQLCKLFEEAIIASLVPTVNTLSNSYLLANRANYYTINPNLSAFGKTTGPWYDLYSKSLHSLGSIYTFAFDEPLWPEVQIFADTYIPNKTYLGITIGPLVQASSSTSLVSSLNPSNFGQTVTFTATVTGLENLGAPTGDVIFSLDGVDQMPVALVNGQAIFQAPILSVASHTLKATYSGDVTYLASSSPILTQVVNSSVPVTKKASFTALISSLNPSPFGQAVTFTATVKGVDSSTVPTGNATFVIDAKSQPAVALINGQATYQVSNLSVGAHLISVIYSGDAYYEPSFSIVLGEIIESNQGILPPINLKVSQVKSQFSTQTNYINILNWQNPLSGPLPTSYRIYRNKKLTQLIGTVSTNQTDLTFKDNNRKKGVSYNYFIVSVDASGNQSVPATVTFNP